MKDMRRSSLVMFESSLVSVSERNTFLSQDAFDMNHSRSFVWIATPTSFHENLQWRTNDTFRLTLSLTSSLPKGKQARHWCCCCRWSRRRRINGWSSILPPDLFFQVFDADVAIGTFQGHDFPEKNGERESVAGFIIRKTFSNLGCH